MNFDLVKRAVTDLVNATENGGPDEIRETWELVRSNVAGKNIPLLEELVRRQQPLLNHLHPDDLPFYAIPRLFGKSPIKLGALSCRFRFSELAAKAIRTIWETLNPNEGPLPLGQKYVWFTDSREKIHVAPVARLRRLLLRRPTIPKTARAK